MKKLHFGFIVGWLVTLILVGCQKETVEPEDKPLAVATKGEPITAMDIPVVKQPLASYVGTVTFLEFEGGFYGIVTSNNEKLLPLNLLPEYRKAGIKLKITGRRIADMMTTVQWGTPFKMESQELVAVEPEPNSK